MAPMGLSPEGQPGLAGVMAQLSELWATVGYTNVDDQPVKYPTDDELAKLADLVDQAGRLLAEEKAERASASAPAEEAAPAEESSEAPAPEAEPQA